ncbi:MAG TPA: helix-turn-helix transcriptional regulator [Candidatus Acidoferrales bacterium]|jgi:plasmid maintenance system antidote protein VapI|nr:helix-turn-helix transcriptional regulator [Candidatus Acidoferrales bacterium]
MTFHDLQQRLIEDLRQRVRSGDVTERGLARATGVSQPHMHNVLKGTRLLSVETADQILRNLDMDLLDLIELQDVREFRGR